MTTEYTSPFDAVRTDVEPIGDIYHNSDIPQLAQETRRALQTTCTPAYSDKDVRQWTRGASRYKEFLAKLSADTQLDLEDCGGPLQGVFLKERSAYLADPYLVSTPGFKEQLQKTGLRCVGRYIYDPEEVKHVLDTHPDVCIDFSTSSPNDFMDEFSSKPLNEYATLRGILLGFPLISINAYQKKQAMSLNLISQRLYDLFSENSAERTFMEREWFGKHEDRAGCLRFFALNLRAQLSNLGITEQDIPELLEQLRFVLNAKQVNVHGITWVDYVSSSESDQKQQRLRAAFALSGILETP